MTTDYSTDPLWADVSPLPLDEGGPNPLAGIAYSETYAQTTAYLRAIMASNELSPRALSLTSDLIALNPAHYTVWLYRAKILAAIHADLSEELKWLNATALKNQKNYQIWHHRQMVVEMRGTVEGERGFIAEMLELDAKNYHVWSFRQWLVKRFGLWGDGEAEQEGEELMFARDMIEQDGRNNSAWNHRWFVLHGRDDGKGKGGVKDSKIRDREVRLAMEEIEKEPGNACPWNYLRGIVKLSGIGWEGLREFVCKFAEVEKQPEEVKSSYALDLMAEILAQEGRTENAERALKLLADKYDPIRKGYWEYRKGLLGLPLQAATATAA